MPETTATGPISGPHQALRELIAASATFQTAVGAADATEALERVYAVAEFAPEWPHAVVCETENEETSIAVGEFGPAEIEFHFELQIDPDDVATEREAYVKFCNTCADIKAEMMEAASEGGMLFVRRINMTTPAMRTDSDREELKIYVAVFRVFVGLES